VALLASSLLVFVIVLSACSQQTPPTSGPSATTSTSKTTTPPTSGGEKTIFKVLNPVGNYIPVQTAPLAPRLSSLAGKNIWYYESEANPVIMPVLLARLKKDYPTATWKYYETQGWGTDTVTAEELKGVDAVIRGIGW